MSTAPAEVTSESESLQEQPGSQPKPTLDDQRPKRCRVWVTGALLLFAVGLVLTLVFRSQPPLSTKQVSVTSQNPENFLRLKGTTEAVQARAILAPLLAGQQIGTLTIIHIAQAGTKIKQGDLLVEFDRQAQMRDIIDKQAEYQKLVDQVAGEQAKESAARAKDETELKTAEDNLRKTELEIQKAEIVSRIDRSEERRVGKECRSTYDQLRETFDLKRRAAQAAIRILEIQRDRTQQTMEHAEANADL